MQSYFDTILVRTFIQVLDILQNVYLFVVKSLAFVHVANKVYTKVQHWCLIVKQICINMDILLYRWQPVKS